jgi:basic membrane lipoprotein Med (substrate-binding protein (PBP1-ABC) superfamily)
LADNPTRPIPFKTANEAVVANMMNRTNAGEQDDPATFYTDDAELVFQDAHMTVRGLQDELQKLSKSFPDFHFRVHDGSLEEQPDGTVYVRFNAVGTHTGAPYAFGPYPEVKTTGIRVEMDAE